MKKKHNQKQEKLKEQHRSGSEKEQADKANKEDEERVDYGGLPDRDLKKNLGGCG